MQTTVNKRVFVHNGLRLQDPDSALSPAAVKDLFSAMYPELLNAEIQGPEISGDELVHTFHRTTGTKGATKVRAGSHTKARAKKSPFGSLCIGPEGNAGCPVGVSWGLGPTREGRGCHRRPTSGNCRHQRSRSHGFEGEITSAVGIRSKCSGS